MRQTLFLGLLSLVVVLNVACQKGARQVADTEPAAGVAETASIRAVMGTVGCTEGVCVADTVMAIDPQSQGYESPVNADGSFQLNVQTGVFYTFAFLNKGGYVASVVFDNGYSNEAQYAYIGTGDSPVQLNAISINGSAAVPENQAATQSDQDGDLAVDAVDEDDDGDSKMDKDEDCDLDGLDDELDDDTSDCLDSDEIAKLKSLEGTYKAEKKEETCQNRKAVAFSVGVTDEKRGIIEIIKHVATEEGKDPLVEGNKISYQGKFNSKKEIDIVHKVEESSHKCSLRLAKLLADNTLEITCNIQKDFFGNPMIIPCTFSGYQKQKVAEEATEKIAEQTTDSL
jgi:hypothetical protein